MQGLAESIAGMLDRHGSLEGVLALVGVKLWVAEVRRIRMEMLVMLLKAPFDLQIKAIAGLGRYDRAVFRQHKRAIRSLCAEPA